MQRRRRIPENRTRRHCREGLLTTPCYLERLGERTYA